MFEYQDWGLIEYGAALEAQNKLINDVTENRNKNFLVFCEHPSVITVGRNGRESNIIASNEFLKSKGIEVYDINRGGDVTLHNPGQLVGYPIFNLSAYKEDLHWFLREIEQCIIDLLENYDIKGERNQGLTGVWLEKERKICAIGFHSSRWVTSHGFALNVNNSLLEFNYIVPCGINDKKVTSIQAEIGEKIDFEDVKIKLKDIFKHKF